MTQTVAFEELAAAARASRPDIAVVLGSGMSEVAGRLGRACSVAFADVPGLGATSVAGHRGRLTFGEWAGKRALIFEGRLHSYETPAEIRALKHWGADAVGMSTAREIQAGYDAGMECAALSCITNRAAGLSGGPLDHQEVLATAAAQTGRLADLLEAFLRQL